MAFGFAFDKDKSIGMEPQTIKEDVFKTYDVYEIATNENNKYEVGDIESLASSIVMTGLQQQLVIKHVNGKPVLLSGERRITAIKYAIENKLDTDDKLEKLRKVRCLVKEPTELDLPLDTEDKEKFLIITTNSEQRKKTQAELLQEAATLSDIYTKLKAADNKYESMLGDLITDATSEKEFISENLSISKAQANRIVGVNNDAIDELKEAVENNDISLQDAYALSRKTELEQEKVVAQINRAKRQAEAENIDEEETEEQTVVNKAVKEEIKEAVEKAVVKPKEIVPVEVTTDDKKEMEQYITNLSESLQLLDKCDQKSLKKLKKEFAKLDKLISMIEEFSI